ncbi:MAG: lysylphosphatidylglycerol synthase transmembrane domain-containing protein [Longicatena sp.]
MKNSFRSYALNLLIILGFTVLVLWFALKDNYHSVMALIANLKWYWLAIILCWGILYAWVIGMILTVFARRNRKKYTYLQGFQNGLVGIFFSGITPSATGGQFAQAYIFKKQGIKYSDGASILWADFIVYQTTMMIYVTILFALRYSHYMDIIGTWFLAILVGYIVNVFVIAVLWTMALFPKLYVRLSQVGVQLLAKMHIVKNKEKTLSTWTIQVEGFTTEIKKMRHEKKMIFKTVALNVIRMTIQFVLPFFIANAIGVNLGWDKFIDCLALSSFVLMANAFIPIPGASGGTELIFTQLFIFLVGSYASASGIMILWRFSTYHVVMLVGAGVFIYLKHKYNNEKYRTETEELDDDITEQEVLS